MKRSSTAREVILWTLVLGVFLAEAQTPIRRWTGLSQSVGGILVSEGDLSIVAPANGGNANTRNEFIGRSKLKFALLGTLPAAAASSAETTSYEDDSPTGEYAPIDADVTEAEGSVDGIFRVGTSSYKAVFAASATANDGFKRTIASDNLEANESIGFWLYSTADLAAGDLQILLTDDGGARNFSLPQVLKNSWKWVEIDISPLAAGTGDAVTEFGITLTSQGATNQGAFTVYMDDAWKWDVSGEEDLGFDIVQDGVVGCFTVVDAAAGANTPLVLAEGTDYFVHYQSGNDAIVIITDNNTESGLCLVNPA